MRIELKEVRTSGPQARCAGRVGCCLGRECATRCCLVFGFARQPQARLCTWWSSSDSHSSAVRDLRPLLGKLQLTTCLSCTRTLSDATLLFLTEFCGRRRRWNIGGYQDLGEALSYPASGESQRFGATQGIVRSPEHINFMQTVSNLCVFQRTCPATYKEFTWT